MERNGSTDTFDALIKSRKASYKEALKTAGRDADGAAARLYAEVGIPVLKWIKDESDKGIPDAELQAAFLHFSAYHLAALMSFVFGENATDQTLRRQYLEAFDEVLQDNLKLLTRRKS